MSLVKLSLNPTDAVLVVLGVLSVVAASIILYKGVRFLLLKAKVCVEAREAIQLLRSGDFSAADELLSSSTLPASKLAKCAMHTCTRAGLSECQRRSEIERCGGDTIRKFESGLRPLAMIAQIAPLLGLLGTVLGMIASFFALGEATGQADPLRLAEGIWQALVTTAVGLTVAIPALAAYLGFEGWIDSVKNLYQGLATQTVAAYFEGRSKLQNSSQLNLANTAEASLSNSTCSQRLKAVGSTH